MRALLVVCVVLTSFLIGPLVAAANQTPRALLSDAALRMPHRTISVYGWGWLLDVLLGFALIRDDRSYSDAG
jgi:hypothetical protein